MKNHLKLVLGLGLITSAHAAVIINPTLASGPGDVIDPAGSQSTTDSANDRNFGTAQATLEARSDLRVLQDFTGFAAGTSGNNIVSFSNSLFPDIQFQFSGNFSTAQAGANGNNELFSTSGTSHLIQRNSASATTSTLTISFGTWNGSAFTADQTVEAAGFTLVQLYSNKSGTVTFWDSAGIQISAFPYSGLSNGDASGNHRDIYFGWDSSAELSNQIRSISITFSDSGDPFNSALDDFAFTAIPEPSGAFLIGGLGLFGLLRRRR